MHFDNESLAEELYKVQEYFEKNDLECELIPSNTLESRLMLSKVSKSSSNGDTTKQLMYVD